MESPPASFDPNDSVGHWLERRAQSDGDRIALIDADRSLDYRTLHERSLRCAAVLADAGIGRGDRIALLLWNRSAVLEIFFAVARLGAIAVPINVRFTAHEIHRLFEHCRPRLLIHEAELAQIAEAACSRCDPAPLRIACGDEPNAYEEALARSSALDRIEPVSSEDPLLLMYTSGTTGTPKGALLPHRKTLFNSRNAEIFFELSPADRVLVVVPLFHSFGLSILSLPTLYAGGTLVLERRFDPAAVWASVERHRITFFGGVPTQFTALLDALDRPTQGPRDLDSLRFLFTAGSAIAPEIVHGYQGHDLILKQGFGQTETSILCCLDSGDALRKAGSVGRPVRHAEVQVVELESLGEPPAKWRKTSVGETGEIVVRGPITMLGYWNDPEATAEVMCDGWLRTGDLASVDTEGFLTLVGRGRDMYISGGENVYPAEIEAVLAEHPSIREAAVVGVPNEKWGEVGRAFLVLEPGFSLDADALRRWGAERLARFKHPADFVAISELPKTATGKVQKHRLQRDG
ncbi:MAG: AMP-binding protein [Myxococcota bacterium]